jgi:hypothetical protein
VAGWTGLVTKTSATAAPLPGVLLHESVQNSRFFTPEMQYLQHAVVYFVM